MTGIATFAERWNALYCAEPSSEWLLVGAAICALAAVGVSLSMCIKSHGG